MSGKIQKILLAALLAAASAAEAAPPTDIESQAAALPFPVQSPNLRPGDEKGTQHYVPGLEQPLFLIGDEPASRRWLRRHREKLRTMNALGLIIEVKSRTRFLKLQAIAPELQLVPTSADAFAEQFFISSYPALLTGSVQ